MKNADSKIEGWSLETILGDEAASRFFSETWSRDAALFEQTLLTGSILDLDSFETLLATLNRAHEGWLHLARGGLKPIPMEMVDRHGMLILSKLLAAFAEGETLYLTKAERVCEALMKLTRALENEFDSYGVHVGEPINAHVFLTPPHAQGFPVHRDAHASFVLQIEGSKTWIVHEPDKSQIFQSGPLDPNSLDSSKRRVYHLRAGDVLYMPEWWPHEATAEDEHSLHVTIRIFPLRWTDLMLHVCRDHSTLSHAGPSMGEPLLAGLLALLDSKVFRQELPHLIKTFSQKLIVSQTKLPNNGFRMILAAARIGPETWLRRRAGYTCEVLVTGEDICLMFRGGIIRGPSVVKPIFEFVAVTSEWQVQDLPAIEGVEYNKLEIVRKLVNEGIFEIGGSKT